MISLVNYFFSQHTLLVKQKVISFLVTNFQNVKS